MNSLYPQAQSESEAPASDTPDAPEGEGGDKAPDSGKAALLPKSMFAGMSLEPGQTITLKVDQLYEDEVQVSPAGGEEKPMKRGMDRRAEPEMMDRSPYDE